MSTASQQLGRRAPTTAAAGVRLTTSGGPSWLRAPFVRRTAGALVVAVVVVVLAPRLPAIRVTLAQLPAGPMLAALACQLGALGVRVEVWRTCLAALDGVAARRRDLHAACGAMFLCGLVSRPAAQLLRIALVRRGETGARVGALQLAAADLPPALVEAALLLAIGAAALAGAGAAWPLLAGLAACATVLIVLARGVRGPVAVDGWRVLRHRRGRLRLAALSAAVIGCQLARNAFVLAALGLDPGARRAALLLVTMSIAGALPAGAIGAPAGALLVLPAAQAGAASVAVLAIVAAAAAAYCGAAWAARGLAAAAR